MIIKKYDRGQDLGYIGIYYPCELMSVRIKICLCIYHIVKFKTIKMYLFILNIYWNVWGNAQKVRHCNHKNILNIMYLYVIFEFVTKVCD